LPKTKEKSPSPLEKVFDPNALYTMGEFAERCKVTERQVRRWIDEGHGLKFIQLPQGRRILGQDAIDFLRERVEER
jgi:transcriptional antiterminator